MINSEVLKNCRVYFSAGFLLLTGDSANAVPHYQKLRVRVTQIWGNRRGQPNRSAIVRPHPRGNRLNDLVNLHAW